MKTLTRSRLVHSFLAKVKSSKEAGPRERALLAEIRHYPRPAEMSDVLARMLENIIKKIWISKPTTSYKKLLSFDEMREICLRTRELFLQEPCLLRVKSPVIIFGDVHGQLYDLLDMMTLIGHPPTKRMLFLGDYVDRGDFSLETITFLLAFKLRFPKETYMLRGNHETRCVNRQYGFYDECKKKFPKRGVELWTLFQHVFNCLPMAAVVGGRIFCAHGGISEDLVCFRQLERVYRPTDICDIGLLCDLIWSDPCTTTTLYEPSPRGVSATFGKKAVDAFCASLNIDLICRAHQCVIDGYEFFADRKCLTIFSAPLYCGELDNQAAVLVVNRHLECRVLTFKKEEKSVRTNRTATAEEVPKLTTPVQENVKKSQCTPASSPKSANTCKSVQQPGIDGPSKEKSKKNGSQIAVAGSSKSSATPVA